MFVCLSYMSSLPHCNLLVQLALSSPGDVSVCVSLSLSPFLELHSSEKENPLKALGQRDRKGGCLEMS